jgi:hypothetical protein
VRASIDTFCGGNRDETPVKHGKRRDPFPDGEKSQNQYYGK